MICQAVSISVSASMSSSVQATPYTSKGGSGRGYRGVWGGNHKQAAAPNNCNHFGKAGHYVQDYSKRNTYWYPPPAGAEYTYNKVKRKKVAKSGVTMPFFSVCKHWDYHNAPGHDALQAT